MTVQLYLGDCLEIMPTLPMVDAIITDLPYGTTACKWDEVIPFAPMWAAVKRLLKPRGVFVTTASQPFTSRLIISNLEMFKYCWVWDKRLPTGFLDANRRPLRQTEDIIVFSGGATTYNPTMRTGKLRNKGNSGPSDCYGRFERVTSRNDQYYPTNLLSVSNANQSGKEHPTQKPVALYEYLILTYTNPGETVLDITAGSGTTGVACVKAGRNFIGIEKDAGYFAIMERRIAEAQMRPRLEGGVA